MISGSKKLWQILLTISLKKSFVEALLRCSRKGPAGGAQDAGDR